MRDFAGTTVEIFGPDGLDFSAYRDRIQALVFLVLRSVV